VFRSIVEPAPLFAALQVSKVTHRCRVRHETIRDDRFSFAMTFQRLLEAAQSRRFVPLLGDIAPEHFALVIDRAP